LNQNNLDFQKIFKDYYNPLVNFINYYLNNIDDSREVVQNVFFKLWENKESLNVRISFKSYIYQSAKNTMIDYIRANKKHKGHTEVDTELIQRIEDSNHTEPEPYIIRTEIQKLLLEVKPKNREIFELNKFEGLTYEEIADYLKISKRTVEDNVSRTMIFLKEKLKNNTELFN
jgi:RNA polymerase sigma-70 factor (ECF subfamily)